MEHAAEMGAEQFCYVTTKGRRTGRPHTIEIWFGVVDRTLYLLSGGGMRSDWVANLVAAPDVSVRVGSTEYPARARIVDDPDEEARARPLLAGKYLGWKEGEAMSGWAQTALVIALDLA
ncbi:MAG TPA: nitroreductase family deazaflavin-dependent oxidoreductase [Actinomycetota bacterium]|nr:nitroreductase family deazaflavin-dependent oxidoreductase [Actinomycetota bacterium]